MKNLLKLVKEKDEELGTNRSVVEVMKVATLAAEFIENSLKKTVPVKPVTTQSIPLINETEQSKPTDPRALWPSNATPMEPYK